jgi:hypothetical protein
MVKKTCYFCKLCQLNEDKDFECQAIYEHVNIRSLACNNRFIPNDEWKEYEELCEEIGFPVQ